MNKSTKTISAQLLVAGKAPEVVCFTAVFLCRVTRCQSGTRNFVPVNQSSSARRLPRIRIRKGDTRRTEIRRMRTLVGVTTICVHGNKKALVL